MTQTTLQPKSKIGLFILVTFLFSWSCWLLVYFTHAIGPLKDVLITLGVLGPAIGAFVSSRDTMDSTRFQYPFWILLAIVTAGSYYWRASRSAITDNSYDLPALLNNPMAIGILVINILAATWFFIKAINKNSLQTQKKWWLYGLVFFPLLMLIVYGIGKITGLPLSSKYHDLSSTTLLISVLIAIPAVFFLHAGIEELGWRKYLQANLEQTKSPLTSALITGLLWGAWHLPLHFIGFYGGGASPVAILTRILVSICLAIILAWFYKSSGRSLITVMLLHTMSNLSVSVFPQNGLLWFAILLLSAIAFMVSGKMWRKV